MRILCGAVLTVALFLAGCSLFQSRQVELTPEQVATLEERIGSKVSDATDQQILAEVEKLFGETIKGVTVDNDRLVAELPPLIVKAVGAAAEAAGKTVGLPTLSWTEILLYATALFTGGKTVRRMVVQNKTAPTA